MSLFLGYGTSSGDLNTGDNLSESSFLEALFGLELGHADDADFFAAHLSPITIYWKKSGKLLIAIGIACVTDGYKRSLSLTHPSKFGLYPSRFCLCCKAKRLFCD